MKFVNFLIKPASSLCNLRCKYCFYEDEAQNRSHHNMGIMDDTLAEALICQAFQAVDSGGSVSFAFQGGEPTVAGLDFFRNFTARVKALKPPDIRVSYAIQTNGTLLDEAWAKFLKQEHFLVGLSLDGFRSVHNTNRVDPQGRGTWQRAIAGKRLLEQYAIEHNALCVVTETCAKNPEMAYKTLKSLGFRYMQFIACLDPIGRQRGQETWSLSPKTYGTFLCQLFELWYRDWQAGDYHSIRLFEDYVHILTGDGASTCATCGKCGAYFVVEADGSVYPCDFFARDDWCLGNIQQEPIREMDARNRVGAFMALDAARPKECAACPYGTICNGGCKNDWYTDEAGTHNYNCAAFKMFLDHALPRLQHIAHLERTVRSKSR